MARILVVEDERFTVEPVAVYLRASGHACTVEGSGAHALEQLKRAAYDLVVLDVMLPGVSGFEVCRRIRRDAALFRMPVLIVSAMRNEEEVLHGLGQGADDYIVKPVDVPSFRRRVDVCCVREEGAHCR